jgi:hypothetical protein
MLWELLVAVGAAMFIIVPVQTARSANAGVGGFALAVCVGLALAVAYEVVMHKAADVLERKLLGRSKSARNWCLRTFYLGTAVFPLFIAYLDNTRPLATLLRFRNF